MTFKSMVMAASTGAVFAMGLAGSAQGAMLVNYSIAGAGGFNIMYTTTPPIPVQYLADAATIDPNVTASLLTPVGTSTTSNPQLVAQNKVFGTFSENVLQQVPNAYYGGATVRYATATDTDAAAAVSTNTYFSFTLTPSAGQQFAGLTALQLDAGRGSNSSTRGFVVRSSLDSFASNLFSSDITSYESAGPGGNGLQHFSIPLSAINLGDSTPVTFRIYSYIGTSTSSGAAVDYKNIEVDGAVAAVPEPASLGLLGITAMALASRRRKA